MEYGKKNKKGTPSCMLKGPGPQYELKTLTGFEDHDPSRRRNPCYSMKFRPKTKITSTGPGPYPIAHHLTHRGFGYPPAYTMAFKPRKPPCDKVPGPGAYAPEKCPPMNHYRRAAAYTIRFKKDQNQYRPGPGPAYMLPTCIGPEIPDIRAEGAYTMAFKHKHLQRNIGPGPAAYNIELDIFKRKYPAYSMKFRHKPFDFSRHIPGPGYSYDMHVYKKKQPVYSFGLKHSECTIIPITAQDEI